MHRQADVLILGAGLAGLSLAVALIDKGQKVIVADRSDAASGASGVPIGLVNPAAAKQANLSWNARQCMSAVVSLLERATSHSGMEFYRKSGVLRPSADIGTLEAFRSSLNRHAFPSGWARWMDSDETDAFHPGLRHAGGALWVNEGYVVDASNYLRALSGMVLQRGSDVLTHCEMASKLFEPNAGIWDVTFSDGSTAKVSHVVNAIGAGVLNDPDWKWMPVHPIKGQMAVYRSSKEIEWTHAVASRGYVAHLNRHDWVIGSTFEHTFKSLDPDEEGLNFLNEKVDHVLPHLRVDSKLQQQWTGVRIGTPNRLPIIGRHPEQSRLWVFTGLGSKGLLYSAYLGQLLASHMAENTPIPPEVDIARVPLK